MTGIRRTTTEYRLYITGQAVITVPLLFDEIYVLVGNGNPPKREMLIDSLGKYIARSRLKKGGTLNDREVPDIKALLKKAGLSWTDKHLLDKLI
jgi:hypothetical protein